MIEMERWRSSLLCRFLRLLLMSATYPVTIRFMWTRLHWTYALIGSVVYDECHPNIVGAVWVYFSNPTFRRVTVAANANPVLQSAPKRLSVLQRSPGTLIDVLRCLPRIHVDACLVVCRDFSKTIDERARDLPVYRMTVGLRAHPPLFKYLAQVAGCGTAEGRFFYGLRKQDRPYFRNAVLTITTHPGLNLVSIEVLGSFFHGLSLDERNLRIERLNSFACTNEAPAIFQLARTHDIPCLQISYEYRRNRPATDFIATIFEEARRTPLPKLVVSVKDVSALSCVEVDAVGRKLLSEILEHYRAPAAKELLTIDLPLQLRRYPLISRVLEALVRESSSRLDSKVAYTLPRSSFAELWPDHSVYFNETSGLYNVPYKHGVISYSAK